MDLAPLMSTGKDDWETPDDLFKLYDSLYRFALDAAANEVNHKCDQWLGPGSPLGLYDALTADWKPWLVQRKNIWLNPPYSKGLQSKFVRKAADELFGLSWKEREDCGSIVCLLPARTDTKLFHEICQRYGQIEFLKGRVKFKGASQGAPFPSMVVVFE